MSFFSGNPVIFKELIVSGRRNKTVTLITFFVFAVMIYHIFLLSFDRRIYDRSVNSREEHSMLFIAEYAFVSFGGICIFALLGAAAVAGERNNKTYDILRASPLTEREIIYGKIISLLAGYGLYISAFLPLFSVTAAFYGFSVLHVFKLALVSFFSAGVFISAGVYVSVYFKSVAQPIIILIIILTVFSVISVAEINSLRIFRHYSITDFEKSGAITFICSLNFVIAFREMFEGSIKMLMANRSISFFYVLFFQTILCIYVLTESAIYSITPNRLKKTLSVKTAIYIFGILNIINIFSLNPDLSNLNLNYCLPMFLLISLSISIITIIRFSIVDSHQKRIYTYPDYIVFLAVTSFSAFYYIKSIPSNKCIEVKPEFMFYAAGLVFFHTVFWSSINSIIFKFIKNKSAVILIFILIISIIHFISFRENNSRIYRRNDNCKPSALVKPISLFAFHTTFMSIMIDNTNILENRENFYKREMEKFGFTEETWKYFVFLSSLMWLANTLIKTFLKKRKIINLNFEH